MLKRSSFFDNRIASPLRRVRFSGRNDPPRALTHRGALWGDPGGALGALRGRKGGASGGALGALWRRKGGAFLAPPKSQLLPRDTVMNQRHDSDSLFPRVPASDTKIRQPAPPAAKPRDSSRGPRPDLRRHQILDRVR